MGNIISDFVKGRKQFDYPDAIRQGITLHRLIDRFTDEHAATRAAKEYFRPAYRLYSGAFVDVVYDHFLAIDENEFSESSLFGFSQEVYRTLDQRQEWLPAPFAGMYPYMKDQNWLYNYRTLEGTRRSLGGIVRRSAYLEESQTACKILETCYQPLQDCYRQLWQDLRPFIRDQFELWQERGGTG